MKHTIFLGFLSMGFAALSATPEVSNVQMKQDKLMRGVTITYTLSAPAVVTADILTNAQ